MNVHEPAWPDWLPDSEEFREWLDKHDAAVLRRTADRLGNVQRISPYADRAVAYLRDIAVRLELGALRAETYRKFENGRKCLFTASGMLEDSADSWIGSPTFGELSGSIVTIVGVLDSKTVDPEVGIVYRAAFGNVNFDAYESELAAVEG